MVTVSTLLLYPLLQTRSTGRCRTGKTVRWRQFTASFGWTGIVFKIRQRGKVVNKTIYLAVGLNRKGYKEILEMWLKQDELAAFWQDVMSDLKARGVEDTLVTVTDNLNCFTWAITNVFPMANTLMLSNHGKTIGRGDRFFCLPSRDPEDYLHD